MPHLKDGALFDFKKLMKEWRIWDTNDWNATDFVYEYPNGSLIKFIGMEDPEKAHGPGRDILYINEANHISKSLYDQLSQRTTRMELLDWNPANFTSWVYDLEDDPKNKSIVSTYKNNLSNLSQKIIDKIESYALLDDLFMWNVYGLGVRGASEELIYPKWRKIDRMPGKGDRFFGLDFGFVNPCALVEVEHHEGANYLQEKLYTSGKTIADIIKLMDGLGISKRLPIYADSAEPKSIEEIFRAGYNIHPADKDVWAGILTVKSYPMYITSDSPNLQKEANSYKWAKNRAGILLEEPVKDLDHGLDGGRYAIHTHLTKPKLSWITL